MTELRATIAIVRRRIDRRFALDWTVQALLVFAISAIFGRLLTPAFTLLAVCVLAAASASERSHVDAMRRTSLFAMPLYGRVLARAQVVAPLALTSSIVVGWIAGALARGAGASLAPLVPVVVVAPAVTTLVAISSVYRDGTRAWLYALLGIVAGVAVAAPVVAHVRHAYAFAAAIAAIAGFFALRAFGETLARFDPIPSERELARVRPERRPSPDVRPSLD